jgi:hypothetical protein
LVDEGRAEPKQSFDLFLRQRDGEVHVHPVLAGRGTFNPEEQDG